MQIYIKDVVKSGLCVAGFKEWSHSNGFDWRDLLRNGMSIEEVDAIDCAIAKKVAAYMRRDIK